MFSNIFIFNILAAIITLVFIIAANILSPKLVESEKLTAYECGFEPFNDTRGTFNIHFYIIAILFIVFDLEIAFLFPWAKNLYAVGLWGFWSVIAFLIILTVGFIYEWKKGALTWSKKRLKTLSFFWAIGNIFQKDDEVLLINLGEGEVISLDAPKDGYIINEPILKGFDFMKYLQSNLDQFSLVNSELFYLTMLLGLLLLGAVLKGSLFKEHLLYSTITLVVFLTSYLFYIDLSKINIFEPQYIFNGFLVIDWFSATLKFMILLFGGCMLFITYNWYKNQKVKIWEMPQLFGWSLFFMISMISANDLIVFYISMEGLALLLYILAALGFTKGSLEASVKYFSLGAIASSLILFFILISYLLTKTTNYIEIVYYFSCIDTLDPNILYMWTLPIVCLIIGFLFKLAAFPNHLWAPEVYEGVVTPVTAFFAIPVKLTMFAVFVKFLYFIISPLHHIWIPMLYISAGGSLIVGCLGALTTNKIKKFLAYASINHMGFLLLGLISNNHKGLQSSFFYLIIYLITSVLIFTVLLNIYNSETKQSLVYISDFRRLLQGRILFAIVITVVFFSMAGIPPLAGFFSKYYVLISLLDSSLYFLASIALITSVISAFYYLKIIKNMWFESKDVITKHFYFSDTRASFVGNPNNDGFQFNWALSYKNSMPVKTWFNSFNYSHLSTILVSFLIGFVIVLDSFLEFTYMLSTSCIESIVF